MCTRHIIASSSRREADRLKIIYDTRDGGERDTARVLAGVSLGKFNREGCSEFRQSAYTYEMFRRVFFFSFFYPVHDTLNGRK